MGSGVLDALFNVGVGLSIVATVASLGLSMPPSAILEPLRRLRLVVSVAVFNVVLVPAAAWGITEIVGLSEDAAAGVTLAAIGSAGAAGLKATQLSRRADLGLALSLVIVLQALNLIAVPLWAGRVVTGATLSPTVILRNLLVLVLVPLVVGLAVRSRLPERASAWHPILVRTGNVALVVALVAGVVTNLDSLGEFAGSGVTVASIAIVTLALLGGTLVGGREPATRVTTGLVTGMRFAALGLIVIGAQLDGDPTILGPAIVYALIDLVLAVGAGVAIGRRSSGVAPEVV